MLTAQHAVAADLAHRVPVREFGMGNVAHRAIGTFTPGTPVATPVAGALPGLGSWLQYRYHDSLPSPPVQFPIHTPSAQVNGCGKPGAMLIPDVIDQFQMAATRYAN